MDITDEHWNEAGMLRLRGELLLATGDQDAAEENYYQALAVAQQQNAKPWNCVLPPVSLVCGATRANVRRRAIFSLRSTAGSPRGSIRRYSGTPNRC
jgi:hypothetical protein